MKKYIKFSSAKLDTDIMYCSYFNGELLDFGEELNEQIAKLKQTLDKKIASGDKGAIDFPECQVTQVSTFIDENGELNYEWDDEVVEYCADADKEYSKYIKSSTESNSPDAKKSKLVREIIKQAKEVRDYFKYHNNNLNRKQDQLLEDLSDGIDNQSISAIRTAIEGLQNNSKNMRQEQFYLINDFYNEFNFADGKFQGMGRAWADDVEACGDIECSTKPKYFANMVSASSDEYEQFVPFDDEDDSTWEEPKYHAYSYYGSNYSGLEDDYITDDPSDLINWVWEHAAHGGFIEVCGPKACIRLDPDNLEERVANGDIGEYEIISQIDYL